VTDISARIVDLGCANGGLLNELATLGYHHLQGVDPSAECAAATARLDGLEGYQGTIFDLPEATRDADCVILSHVLEHVRDVGTAVAHLRSTVRDGGVAYVEVPDATRYSQCLVAPFQDFNVEHINHFSPISLANALQQAGFEVERVDQRTISASSTAPYPAVSAVARATASTPLPVRRDNELAPAVRDYVERSRALLGKIERHLERELSDVDAVVMWGTGQTTLTILSNTRVGGARVTALTDSNPRYHGRHLAGIPVVAPEDVGRFTAPIVIGSIIHQSAIETRIRQLGLPNRIVRLSPN
jgi:SAM-dependent methyltransferase